MAYSCNRTNDQNRDDGNEETCQHVEQTIAFHHRFKEVVASLDTYRGQEQYQTDLSKHHVRRSRGIGDQMDLVAITANENGDNQRTTSQTQFHWNRHARDSKREGTEDQTNKDTNEDRGNVWRIQTTQTVTHLIGYTVNGILRTHHHNLITYLQGK